MTTPPPLTSAQQQAAALLGAGKTPSQVSDALDISRTALYRWRKREDFAALVDEATATSIKTAVGAVEEGRDAILKLVPAAAARLAEALDAETYVVDGEGMVHEFANWHARLKAIRLITDIAGLNVHKVEHSGEMRLQHMTEQELRDGILRLLED